MALATLDDHPVNARQRTQSTGPEDLKETARNTHPCQQARGTRDRLLAAEDGHTDSAGRYPAFRSGVFLSG